MDISDLFVLHGLLRLRVEVDGGGNLRKLEFVVFRGLRGCCI